MSWFSLHVSWSNGLWSTQHSTYWYKCLIEGDLESTFRDRVNLAVQNSILKNWTKRVFSPLNFDCCFFSPLKKKLFLLVSQIFEKLFLLPLFLCINCVAICDYFSRQDFFKFNFFRNDL